jgi:malonyl CoA-acyl carrier protein transacylase
LISSLVGVVVVVVVAGGDRSEEDAERAVRRRAAQVALAVEEDAERLSIIAWMCVRVLAV